ncbi:MAG: MutS-related protein [Cellulosilyticaceae bacterium]
MISKEQFEKYITKYELEKKELQKKYNQVANGRLILIILIIGSFSGVILEQFLYLSTPIFAISVIGFIILMRYHQNLKNQIDHKARLIKVNLRYLKRIGDEWKMFEDTGIEHLEYEHPYAYDLDLLGSKSLFQKINTTHTWFGRKALLETLLNPTWDQSELLERQKAITELHHQYDFCQNLESISNHKMQEEHKTDKLIKQAKTETTFRISWLGEKIILILPVIVILFIVVGYLMQSTMLWIVAAIFMVGQYGYQLLYINKINEVKSVLETVHYDLEVYSELIKIIETASFSATYMSDLQAKLTKGNTSAGEGIKQLEKIANKAQLSHQPIAAIILNATVLWDLKVINAWKKWQKKYGNKLEEWLQIIGIFESLVSLSVLGHLENMSIPIIEENDSVIIAKEIGHPLISQSVRVNNSCNMNNQCFVITGSNMSGKTTFLRTIGINLVLAYAGAPVLAEMLRCSMLNICTSMRIQDNLQEGISTFYAELKRIKMIIDMVHQEKTVLFLIDEIFRGTNSMDRITGAKSVMYGLKKSGAIGAMTTHDLELCNLENDDKIQNYHFTETYEENNILFDYKLKEGPSTTTNARYLMKMVGIDLVE